MYHLEIEELKNKFLGLVEIAEDNSSLFATLETQEETERAKYAKFCFNAANLLALTTPETNIGEKLNQGLRKASGELLTKDLTFLTACAYFFKFSLDKNNFETILGLYPRNKTIEEFLRLWLNTGDLKKEQRDKLIEEIGVGAQTRDPETTKLTSILLFKSLLVRMDGVAFRSLRELIKVKIHGLVESYQNNSEKMQEEVDDENDQLTTDIRLKEVEILEMIKLLFIKDNILAAEGFEARGKTLKTKIVPLYAQRLHLVLISLLRTSGLENSRTSFVLKAKLAIMSQISIQKVKGGAREFISIVTSFLEQDDRDGLSLDVFVSFKVFGYFIHSIFLGAVY